MPRTFHGVAVKPAFQNNMKMRGNCLLPGVRVSLLPFQHRKAFRRRQTLPLAGGAQVAQKIFEIPPRLCLIFRAFVRGICQCYVQIVTVEICNQQTAEPAAGNFGVVVCLCFWRSAKLRRFAVRPVKVAAFLRALANRVYFDLLVLRRRAALPADVAAFPLVSSWHNSLAVKFCILVSE